MAHHNRTPQSVLDAPTRTVVVVSAQPHAPRAIRRHDSRLVQKFPRVEYEPYREAQS